MPRRKRHGSVDLFPRVHDPAQTDAVHPGGGVDACDDPDGDARASGFAHDPFVLPFTPWKVAFDPVRPRLYALDRDRRVVATLSVETGLAECEANDRATAVLDGTGSRDPDSTPGTDDDVATFAWSVGGEVYADTLEAERVLPGGYAAPPSVCE